MSLKYKVKNFSHGKLDNTLRYNFVKERGTQSSNVFLFIVSPVLYHKGLHAFSYLYRGGMREMLLGGEFKKKK
jgi:hypothetical protein